jgi:multidrug efflux system outer membrane protein
MKHHFRVLLFLLFIFLGMVSCSPFTPREIPDAAGELPETYTLFNGQAEVSLPWWESVGSIELNRLISEALAESFTLKEAWARLQQSRALAVQAGADRYPHLEGFASADLSTQRHAKLASGGSDGDDTYTLGLLSSYELDLWGRIRSQREAALTTVAATHGDLQTAGITIAAEVAKRWTQILSQRLQKQLLERQLENSLIFLDLIELRFRKAMVSALDVYQQKQVVENIRARIPLVEAQTQLLSHELAVLLGRPPRADLGLSQTELPEIDRLPAVGLPADLLANRPDVRAAGMRLKVAQWQVAAARANRLPALQLTAGAQYGASHLDLLFDTWLLRLAADLTAPLLDGGRRAAEVDRTQAQVDENLWHYRQTVLTAIKEVEDALESETRQREHINGLESVMAAARRGLEEAIQRYRRGLSDYLPVLTQLIAVQDLERDLIVQQEALIRYRIALHRSLGGGWIEAPASLAGTGQEQQRK